MNWEHTCVVHQNLYGIFFGIVNNYFGSQNVYLVMNDIHADSSREVEQIHWLE